ncbi:ISSod6 transposase-like protein [Wolbachia endosymbiont of Armadillidium vulgare str. wVulC]|nr:ISSod6 transposase-like protein [Wolbachia endosymbiont of Armadillidium vulgare str. wVulC]
MFRSHSTLFQIFYSNFLYFYHIRFEKKYMLHILVSIQTSVLLYMIINIEKLPYEISHKKRNLEANFAFLKSTKGIHSKNEEKLRIFMEAVWQNGCQ